MQSLETLDFKQDEGVAIITLNRPDSANGIDLTMAKELDAASKYCEEEPSIRAILLTGAGKMFSAGGDLKSFAAEGNNMAALVETLIVHLHAAVERLASMPKPVVIAVNGTAAGAGFSLACIGDSVIASDKAKFTMAYSAAGLTPDGGASFFLPRLIGMRKTQELMLENTLLSAEDAKNLGIASQVEDTDSLFDIALAKAKAYANAPTKAFGAIKHLLNQSFSSSLNEQLTEEGKQMVASMKTKDGKEGIEAFLNKRKPVFTGE